MRARQLRRVVGGLMIFWGFWLATPPGIPPDDIINLATAGFLESCLGLPLILCFVLSYFIGLGILLLGFFVYPGNTITQMKKAWRKFLGFLKKIRRALKQPI